jgi:hypothetical protein
MPELHAGALDPDDRELPRRDLGGIPFIPFAPLALSPRSGARVTMFFAVFPLFAPSSLPSVNLQKAMAKSFPLPLLVQEVPDEKTLIDAGRPASRKPVTDQPWRDLKITGHLRFPAVFRGAPGFEGFKDFSCLGVSLAHFNHGYLYAIAQIMI